MSVVTDYYGPRIKYLEERLSDTAAKLRDVEKERDAARAALERARTILGNMAQENVGAIFNRWPISHEPLRADAKNVLPVIDAALSGHQTEEP